MSGTPSIPLVLVLLGMSIGCGRPPDFERMRRQPRLDPYEASRVFSDGTAMRVPPQGTVPHAAGTSSGPLTTGLERGSPIRDLPLPITPDLVVLGQHHYEIFCAVCHGAEGSGRAVMSANMPGVPPPALPAARMAAYPAGYLFQLIAHGKNRMPSYEWALPPADRWAVIAYLQQRQQASAPPPGSAR